ncbi:MAG: pyridoxal phosphate-dependent aminotransferase [Candidatus Bipolaricaulota bacterium]
MSFANRINSLSKSKTQEINDRAGELKRQGRDLIDLGAGEPRFEEPRSAREAGRNAIETGFTNYTEVGGIPELKSAILERYDRVYGVKEGGFGVTVTTGAKAGLYEISQILYEEGDEVILPRPYWVSYPAQVKLAGAEPVFVSGKPENHYLPTAEEIEEKIDPRTRGILINSPANPSGGVYEEAQGEELVELAGENDLFLVSDECYDGFVYEQDRFWTLASSGYEKGLVVGSASKNFAMTGWRLGYVLGISNYVEELEKIQSHLTSSPPSISQKAAEAAFSEDLTLPRALREKFKKRRDYLVRGLSRLTGVYASSPPGSFYLFPRVGELLEKLGREKDEDVELSRILLEEAGVVTVPGSAFGKPGHLRLAYLPEIGRLEEAVDRMEATIETLL